MKRHERTAMRYYIIPWDRHDPTNAIKTTRLVLALKQIPEYNVRQL